MLSQRGDAELVESIVYNEREVAVYNLDVENTSIYFAGGIGVHNQDITGLAVGGKDGTLMMTPIEPPLDWGGGGDPGTD